MEVQEFEKLSRKELRRRADAAFIKANEKGPGYLMEAQFYMRELEHRHDSWISFRDLILEIVVIALIALELWEGNAQARLIASQTQILQNLQNSTKSTAESIAAQLALQYKVFVNVQYNGNKALSLFNNSKSDIMFYGIKIGNRPAEANPTGPISVAGAYETTISLEDFYPKLFDNLPATGSISLPISLYLKGADNQEYVTEGTYTFSRQGGTGESKLRAEQWSGMVTFSPTPSGNQRPSSRLQSPR
jgi:hypothetical protein